MRGFASAALGVNLIVVALLVGELRLCCTAAAAAASAAQNRAVRSYSEAPTTSPSPRRRRHRSRASNWKQDPAPPRLVLRPPQEPIEPPPARPSSSSSSWSAAMNSSYVQSGCSTLLVLGDSTVDPGNNNHLLTTAKANFLPYGITTFLYARTRPSGRFSNGRLPTDFLADKLGIATTIPGFLDPELKIGQLSKGVSFASAGSGYDDATANRLNVVSFPGQIRQLWRYKILIRRLVGAARAEWLVNRATLVVSAGTNDLLFNYLDTNRSAPASASTDAGGYDDYLIARLANYTQVMMMLGGRRFMFVGLPPIGCLPIATTLLGTAPGRCDDKLNSLAASFNSKLLELSNLINYQHSEARAAYIDTYAIIREATNNPNNFGFTEVRRGCCGTGMIEVGQTCRGRRTCPDPSKFLYWDAIHPTEAANQLIADAMLTNISQLYS